MSAESRSRSLLKAISWRIWATVATMLISFSITHNWQFAFSIGSVEVFAKVGLFYMHERLWATFDSKKRIECA
jgi:uncharacterized membrane protein